MSRDAIIAMAREAGFRIGELQTPGGARPLVKPDGFDCLAELERFAALAAAKTIAKEREECAQMCDEICAAKGVPFYGLPGMKGSAKECAAAIRARGKPCA